VDVKTDQGEYAAASLVITAGPWASAVLEERAGGSADGAAWGKLLRVIRKPVFWFNAGAEYDVAAGTPTFFFETPAGQFYGFPRIDGRTMKIAEHTQGEPVADPLAVERAQIPDDLSRLGGFLREHLPGLPEQPDRHSVCLYTKTPDSHFCIDLHPLWANVAVGAGFSGHGFKFTTVLGEALADLALQAKTNLPVGFLSVERFK